MNLDGFDLKHDIMGNYGVLSPPTLVLAYRFPGPLVSGAEGERDREK